MLLLHDLHPLSLEARVAHAVDGLRERLHGKLEDVSVDARDGRIGLRIVPVRGSCGSTRSTLKREFEDTLLAAAPDAESISVELTEPAPALVTLRLRRLENGEHENRGPR
jgi:Fe-S cluster biogenesis protein NfuA